MARIVNKPALCAFLDLIAKSEGTSSSPASRDDGYDIIVTGVTGPNTFTNYSTHPFANDEPPILVRPTQSATYGPDPKNPKGPPILLSGPIPAIYSTASGRYQIIKPTWEHLAPKYQIKSFSPQNQDLLGLYLLDECHATDFILAGNVSNAIDAAANTWASFPGNLYGQGGHSLEELCQWYYQLLTAQP